MVSSKIFLNFYIAFDRVFFLRLIQFYNVYLNFFVVLLFFFFFAFLHFYTSFFFFKCLINAIAKALFELQSRKKYPNGVQILRLSPFNK